MGILCEKIDLHSNIAEKKAEIINILLWVTKSYIDKYSIWKSSFKRKKEIGQNLNKYLI